MYGELPSACQGGLGRSYHISIDTCVLGKGYEVLSVYNSKEENMVGFEHKTAIKPSNYLR
jgi:hypothetical protein